MGGRKESADPIFPDIGSLNSIKKIPDLESFIALPPASFEGPRAPPPSIRPSTPFQPPGTSLSPSLPPSFLPSLPPSLPSHLAGMALRPWHAAEAAIEISTGAHEGVGFFHVWSRAGGREGGRAGGREGGRRRGRGAG
jgi:hypothetical protein